MKINFVSLALALLVALPGAGATVATDILLRNGDFEEPGTPPPAWEMIASPGENCALSSDAMTGQHALKISLPVDGGNATVSSAPCPVTAGEDYLFTCWARADGAKESGTISADIVWQNTSGTTIGSVTTTSFNPPVPDYCALTYLATAPAGAAQARVRYRCYAGKGHQGPATAFFIDQVRLLKLPVMATPAHPQTWEYVNRVMSFGSKMVADHDAAQGEAIAAESGVAKPGIYLAFGPYTLDQPVGEYSAMFRLKVKDNARHEPVASLDISPLGGLGGLAEAKTVYASDFKQPGVYQDIALHFVRPEEGALEFRVCYQGTTDLTYDRVTIVQLADFSSDQEQTAIWLGDESAAPSRPAVLPASPAAKRDTVLVLAGLGHQACFPTNALPPTLKCQYSYLARIQTGVVLDQPFPKKLDALDGVGVVVLADVPAAALNGLMGRRTLRQFVARGGGLLVFGGPLSLGKGGYAESALAPVLPVTLAGPWDLKALKAAPVKIATPSPLTDGLHWDEKPVVLYCQKTIAKPEANTLLECRGLPVLVTGRYGEGRVAVFAGTSLGEPLPGHVPFFEWSGYPDLLARVLAWLRNG